ncbi:coiled-coil domain-containing protein 63-like [Physella acuta]|uniref:coiled-coil domain-containing protein 63-like n=1 Tax=Physella acuta TaxID=109671 RepID=UPI0027DE74E7|nr:coiled-coil domain-containing protein 63-like [Physella acuta]XP_059169302.1 coiled-coil domain-containing protein 63-like [Physella acuta]
MSQAKDMSKEIDLAELIELQKQREQMAVEEKLKAKMRRQIRIFNKEKSMYTRRTRYEISKQRRSLQILELERDVELDNYIATQSEAIENKYKKEECVVRDLVSTTDDVRRLLAKEIESTNVLDTEVRQLDANKWEQKKAVTQNAIENSKFRLPDKMKMERRIEWASGKYHSQLYKNKELQDKIDSAIFLRDKFMNEETKLVKKLEELNKAVTTTMNETAEIYEQRDRAEGTKIKVREHLAKVKDQYERELLNISLSINDDKKMENFMRTKHKDITKYLHMKREKELKDVTEMLSKKDNFTQAFDTIKEATGKDDINQIVEDFIEAEEDNFSTFLGIGEILDENERLRSKIRDLRNENVSMEENNLETLADTAVNNLETQARIESYKLKSEACQKRLADQSKTVDEFTGYIQNIINMIKLEKVALGDYIEKDGSIKDRNLLGVMTAIEKELADQMKDYYMVELSTRAVIRGKPDVTPDEKMITRIPSFRIGPHAPPRIIPSNLIKDKEDVEEVKNVGLLTHEEARDIVVKSMLDKKSGSSKNVAEKSYHDLPWIHK